MAGRKHKVPSKLVGKRKFKPGCQSAGREKAKTAGEHPAGVSSAGLEHLRALLEELRYAMANPEEYEQFTDVDELMRIDFGN